jgi:glycosidase
MAEMVPVEFWAWAIPQVKKVNAGIIFIAEIYNPEEYRTYLEKGNFTYLYDKVGLYDCLKAVIQGKAPASAISGCWQQLEGINDKMLRFLENHDEQRIASPFFAGDARLGMPMMTVTATLHSHPVMIYFGQEVGETGSGKEGFGGEDGRTTIFDYWGVPAHQQWMNEGKFDGGKLHKAQQELRNFYQKLLNICLENEAIRQGQLFDLQYFNTHNYDGVKVFTFLRYTDKQKLLIIVNFDTKAQKVKVMFPEALLELLPIPSDSSYVAEDLFTGQTLHFKPQTGVTTSLEGLQSCIFEFKN